MLRTRIALTILAAALASAAFAAESVNLTEEAKTGDCSSYTLELRLSGQMFISQEGRKDPIALDALARHRFFERTLTVDAGQVRRAVRSYSEARVKSAAGTDASDRSLTAEHRLILVERKANGPLCTSPAGPLAREELEIVAGHFPPHALPGLLPGKPVTLGDRWTIDDAAAQAACLFDSISKNELTGKLAAVEGGKATFTIEGAAEGIESGSPVKLTITAEGSFDIAAQRITALVWKQKDVRAEGPISPASAVDATITLMRETHAGPPPELADAVVAALPREADATLRYSDPRGEYRFDYPRTWHITGETDTHLILRLLDGHELLAQATLTRWKPAGATQPTNAEEFRQRIAAIPGWVEKSLIEETERPRKGRQLLRRVVNGEIEGRPVVQSFHLISETQGRQVAATFVMKPEKVKAVGSQDLDLAEAIQFLEKK